MVNDAVDPRTGVHRIRKKKSGKSKQGGRKATGDDEDYNTGYEDQTPQPQYGDAMSPSDAANDNRPPFPPYPPAPYVFQKKITLILTSPIDLTPT